jgi:hypothetical protein
MKTYSKPPPTQILSTITEGSEHPTFGDIPEVEVLHPTNNTSTTAAGSSQNTGGANSTQTNRGASHQLPSRAPSLIQVIQGNAKIEQIQVEDWENEAYGDKVIEEEELARFQQEIERLHQEQKVITRRQAASQRAEARRQHINRERVRLTELYYNIEILYQQEQRQEPPFQQPHHQNNLNPPPLPHFQIPQAQYPPPPAYETHLQPPPKYATTDPKNILEDHLQLAAWPPQ